jgi:glycosyltransferase involved in cell wall biosynthesis
MLRSIFGVIDELVIVDTGSTDGTYELLSSFASGSIKYQYFRLIPSSDLFFDDDLETFPASWEPTSTRLLSDWADARNLALANTTADYVLKLDADDELRVPAENVRALCTYLDRHLSTRFVSSYYDIFDGSGQHLERQAYVRLWRRNSEIFWTQPLHEYLTGKTQTNTELHAYGLLTRDWRDSKGANVRVPNRNLKVLEHHRRKDIGSDINSAKQVLFRYTWASEAALLMPKEARSALFQIETVMNSASSRSFFADVSYQIGRTYEAEGQIEQAKERYELANRLGGGLHFPSSIQLVKMLDTAELRADNQAVLDDVKTKLLQVLPGEIPIGCNLIDYARITGRDLPFPR